MKLRQPRMVFRNLLMRESFTAVAYPEELLHICSASSVETHFQVIGNYHYPIFSVNRCDKGHLLIAFSRGNDASWFGSR
jgi:hypothetical protein